MHIEVIYKILNASTSKPELNGCGAMPQDKGLYNTHNTSSFILCHIVYYVVCLVYYIGRSNFNIFLYLH